jgi:hypothetical protein
LTGIDFLSGEEAVADRLASAQSGPICRKAFASFLWFGITAREVAWIGGIGDPRMKPSQDDWLAFVPLKCSDGIPRLLVRLQASFLGVNPTWMQYILSPYLSKQTGFSSPTGQSLLDSSACFFGSIRASVKLHA